MIRSDTFATMLNGDWSRIPFHTDLALKYYTSAITQEVYDTDGFHVYNLDPGGWNISYEVVDTRRGLTLSEGTLCGTTEHAHFSIDDAVHEFKVVFTGYDKTTSATSTDIETVQYLVRNPDLYNIDIIYAETQLLLEGLSYFRSQNLISEGLAYNQEWFKDTNFNLRPYIPSYIYDEPAWSQLTDYFEEVLGNHFNITKQLNQFDTNYDNINIYTAQKYGVPVEWIQNDYIRQNILKNREQIQDLYYLWSRKGNITALFGALKFFCDTHPYASFRAEAVGWTLTETSGGSLYGITDIDATTYSADTSGDGIGAETYLGGIPLGSNATETYYATDYKMAIKLNYYIDIWGVKQLFGQHDSVSGLIADYEYGEELVNSLFQITNNFAPFNAKVYYWWVNAVSNERVNLWTHYVAL